MPEQRQYQIERARAAVLHEGASATTTLVEAWFDRAWITRSWQRCLQQGRRPEQAIGFDLVPVGARRRAEDAHHALLAAARPEMQRLARAVAPIRYFAILTDAEGCVVETAGAIDRRDRHAEVIARVGVDLSERSIGTSAIGAALGELHPVWLHRGEHFFDATSVYSCAGAPLFGPRGDCVGMLDLTGINVAERPELKHLVARSARAIEDALTLAVPHALRLQLAWDDAAADGDGGALLCLDGEGAVVGANPAARAMLPALGALAGGVVHAGDLFALPWAQLFDQAQRGLPASVPLWSGLRIWVQAARVGTAPERPAAPRLPLRALENDLIHQAVRAAGGNVSQAAQTLGLSRATVYRRLAKARGSGKPARS